MKFGKYIERKNLYNEYVKVLNGLFQLSDRELEIFALLLKIDCEWKPILETDYKNILSSHNRKAIMQETHVQKTNFSKYIRTLKENFIIIKSSTGGYEINTIYTPRVLGGVLDVSFILNTKIKELNINI